MLALSSLKWLSCSTMTFLGWSVWSHPCFWGKGRCSPWSWKPVRNHTILPGKVSQPSWQRVPYVDSILVETPLQSINKNNNKIMKLAYILLHQVWSWRKRVPFTAYHRCYTAWGQQFLRALLVHSPSQRLSSQALALIFTWNKPAGDVHFLGIMFVWFSYNMDEGHLIWMYIVYIYIYLLNSEVDSSHACDIKMQSNPLQVYSNLVILDEFSALRPLCSIHMSARGPRKSHQFVEGRWWQLWTTVTISGNFPSFLMGMKSRDQTIFSTEITGGHGYKKRMNV